MHRCKAESGLVREPYVFIGSNAGAGLRGARRRNDLTHGKMLRLILIRRCPTERKYSLRARSAPIFVLIELMARETRM